MPIESHLNVYVVVALVVVVDYYCSYQLSAPPLLPRYNCIEVNKGGRGEPVMITFLFMY